MTGDRGKSAIRAALSAAGRCDRIASSVPLGGGCIHTVLRLDLADGDIVAAKVNRASAKPMFEEEAAGLRVLSATSTVLAPEPIGIAVADEAAAFVMQWLPPADSTTAMWVRLGEDLAALHHADAGDRYGYETDNHLGSTPQPNGWCDDWVRFNAVHRLGHQLSLARQAGLLNGDDAGTVQCTIDRLDQIIPHHPRPALLHGDLWSGNVMPTAVHGETRIAVIDPACSIGDGWADIAMMKLFGGFPAACFDAYVANVSDHDHLDSSIAAYQLYHVLNHVNLFGRGYVGQAMALCRRLA